MLITRRSHLQLSVADRQGLIDAAITFLSLRERAGIPYKPKMHLMVHMAANATRFGNPRLLGTWLDEGLNRQLANVCRSAHSAVWHRRVLATFNHDALHVKKKKKRRTM